MSLFQPYKQATITVAPKSGLTSDGDPKVGTQQTVEVLLEDVTELDISQDRHDLDVGVKLSTDEYEFEATDFIWLPSANTSNDSDAYTPDEAGTEDLPGTTETISWAIL